MDIEPKASASYGAISEEIDAAERALWVDSMRAKVVITGRVPTVEETAREMGVPAKRVRELTRLMTAIMEERLGKRRVTKRKRATRR